MTIAEFVNEKGILEFHVNDFSSGEGYDNILEFFSSIELGKIVNKSEGPGTKLALIEFGSSKIQLVFSDQIGIYFHAMDANGILKARDLAKALEKRIEEYN